ncbi:MAG: NAD(P)/FAD-dependent oxidoreductase, partial [Alkalispirochaeta sp.]
MRSLHRVVVVGAGFAGIQAAKTLLRGNGTIEVTLIDRNGYTTMLPVLPDILSGRVERVAVTRDLLAVFGDRVRIRRATVTRVALDDRRIYTDDGLIPYDGLILAAGSRPIEPAGMPPGVHTVDTFEGAQRLRHALEAGGNLCVVGGGYTGLEVALNTRLGFGPAPTGPAITVVDAAPEIMTIVPGDARRRLLERIHDAGVEVRTGTTLTDYNPETKQTVLSDGTVLPDCHVCWAPGMRAAGIELTAGELPVDIPRTRDGRFETGATLQLPGYPEVAVAGDLAAIRSGDELIRRAVNIAFYSGRRAAKNVARHLTSGALRPFRPVDLGWVLPLGTASYG